MAITLIRSEDDSTAPYRCRQGTFMDILEIAQIAGWKPSGTLSPKDWEEDTEFLDWNSQDYTSNSHQRVAERDAENLSEALARALNHLIVPKDLKPYVDDLITYAGSGGFEIT